MNIIYTRQVQQQLKSIKSFIEQDNPQAAKTHLIKIKSKIELLASFPYLGQINPILNKSDIRDWILLGYKVIYKISKNQITILAIYKHIDFDESSVNEET
jgi:addiction module RelE/StbE family toxin